MGNLREAFDSYNNNLSLGDKAIASSVTKNLNKEPTSLQDVFDNYINITPETIGTNNIIPVDRNDDNSVKATFDNIYEDEDLANISRDFYFFRDQKQFENSKEAIDYYINDRTWKQANVVSIGKEYSYITGKDLKQDQLQRYAYLTKYWDDLPNMFQEGGGTTGQRFFRFGKNLFYAIADPINIIGIGIGGQVAKAAAKKAAAESIKSLTKTQLAKQIASGEIGKIGKKAAVKAGLKGIATTATVDSLALGGADVARQYTEMEVNPEQKYDALRTGTVAIATFGLSSIAQVSIAGASGMISKAATQGKEATKIGTKKITKTETEKALKQIEKVKTEKQAPIVLNKLISDSQWSWYKTNWFDTYDPVLKLQKEITGIEGSSKAIRTGFAAKMKKSPALLPYFQFRMTAASGARTNAFLKYGIYQPPAKNAKNASYIKGKSKPLTYPKRAFITGEQKEYSILGKFEMDNEVMPFLDYVGAIHMRKILSNAKLKQLKKLNKQLKAVSKYPKKNAKQIARIKSKIDSTKLGLVRTRVPWGNEQIQKAIDYGKLTSRQYYTKYKSTEYSNVSYNEYLKKFARKNNFDQGKKDLKVFTDELLMYGNGSEMVGDASMKAILKEYDEAWIPLTRTKPKETIWNKITKSKPLDKSKEEKITYAKSPVKRLAVEEQEGELNFLQNLYNYAHRTVSAADMNRSKVSLYEMLEAAHKSGKHGTVISEVSARGTLEPGAIVRKVSKADRLEIMKTTVKTLDETLEKQGLKIVRKVNWDDPKNFKALEKRIKNDQVDIMTFTGSIKKQGSDNYIDIVYRKNAKGEVSAEFYEIIDQNLHHMYKSFDLKAARHLSNSASRLSALAAIGEAVGKYTSPVAKYLGRAITYTPTFQAKNFFRDTQAAAITSAFSIATKDGLGFLPIKTSGTALYQATREVDDYRLSLINGLGFATRAETEGLLDTSINKLIKTKNLNSFYANQVRQLFGTKLKSGWIGRGAETYKNFVGKVEYASRLGEFQLAKRAGFDNIAASFAGREVTTDFGMRGSSTILNAMSRNLMFFNASLQGMYRGSRVLFEGTAQERAKAGTVIFALVALPEMGLYFLNKDNKTYEAIPDVHKQLNHLIPVDFEGVDERGNPIATKYFALPKPYDFGIFGNITHALMKGLDENSTNIGFKYALQSLSLLMPMNFIGFVPMANTAMEPVLEMLINEDAFSGVQIRRQYDALTLSDLRLKNNTREISVQVSNLSKLLAEMVIPGSDDKVIDGLDAISIDFIINAYAVGMLKYGVDFLDQGVYYLTGYKKYGEQPALSDNEENIARDPLSIFKRSFTINTPLKNTKYYQIYTELQREAKKMTSINYDTLSLDDGARIFFTITENIKKRMKDKGSPIPKEAIIWDQINASFLKVTDKKLKEINKYIRDIPFLPLGNQAAANGMSEADFKRKLIDQSLKARNELLEKTINAIADLDVPYIFENIIGGKTYVSPKQRRKK
jgi:hypothetical protein